MLFERRVISGLRDGVEEHPAHEVEGVSTSGYEYTPVEMDGNATLRMPRSSARTSELR